MWVIWELEGGKETSAYISPKSITWHLSCKPWISLENVLDFSQTKEGNLGHQQRYKPLPLGSVHSASRSVCVCGGVLSVFTFVSPKNKLWFKKKSRNHTEKGGIQEPESVMDVRKKMPEGVTVESAWRTCPKGQAAAMTEAEKQQEKEGISRTV